MALQVNQGFTGIARIGSEKIRCSSFSVNPKQDILFYDHIVGLRDTAPQSLDAKGESGSFPNNLQKTFYRPGVKIVQGNMEFPVTENISNAIFNLAHTADWFDLDFDYYCDAARRFVDCKINSYAFSVRAGDIATISLGIIGIGLTDYDNNLVNGYTKAEKLVTWDKIDINVSGTGEVWDGLQSFDMTINNNIKPIYTSGSNQESGSAVANNLNPLTLRVGMQHVTGIISRYNKRYQTKDIYAPIDISLSYPDSVNIDMKTIFKPVQVDGSIGPIVSMFGFEAVDKHFY